jgi:hypothetical protein
MNNQDILNLRIEGKSYRYISKLCNKSHETVRQICLNKKDPIKSEDLYNDLKKDLNYIHTLLYNVNPFIKIHDYKLVVHTFSRVIDMLECMSIYTNEYINK